jgi:mono/diheme cytochrome c family protein
VFASRSVVRSGTIALASVVGFGGCAITQTGATAADLARARDGAAAGAATFAGQCAECHGERGQGIGGVPAIMGPGALPEYPRDLGTTGDPNMIDPQQIQVEMQTRPAGAASRDTFRNAQDLYKFVSTRMPKPRPASLSPAEYWAVVNYLLAAQGTPLPAGGIGPANAAATAIARR